MRRIFLTILILSLITQTSVAQKNVSAIESIYVSQVSPIDSIEIRNRKELGTGESTILADNTVERSRIINELQLQDTDHEFLLNILINKDLKDEHSRKFQCYSPNYGILFFDKAGGLIGFIELSTICTKYEAIGISADWEINLSSSEYEYLENWFEENYKE